MSTLQLRLHFLACEAVDELERQGVQPTARQVSKMFSQHDGWAKTVLRSAEQAGLLTSALEWVDKAKAEYTVYRRPLPAVRVSR